MERGLLLGFSLDQAVYIFHSSGERLLWMRGLDCGSPLSAFASLLVYFGGLVEVAGIGTFQTIENT